MRFKLRTILIIFLTSIFIQCEEEDIFERNYPRIKTQSVEEINSAGAKFNAEILFRGDFEILRYGFVWGQEYNPTVTNYERIIFTHNIKANSFSHTVETTLEYGTWYNVRAFVETKNYTVYGENLGFRSLGSNAPEIFSFFPTSGVVGDTITIKGKNFSYVKNHNTVELGTKQSKVVHSTDTTIMAIVPAKGYENEVDLKVSIAGNSNQYSSTFRYLRTTPIITEIYPLEGTFGDTITVIGSDFGNSDTTMITVFMYDIINNHEAEIISTSQNKIEFIVPEKIQSPSNFIRIRFNETDYYPNSEFILKPPVIYDFTPKTISNENEVFTIYGENFHPIENRNFVKIGSLKAIVLMSSKDSLKVQLSSEFMTSYYYNVSSERNYKIELRVVGQSVISSEDLYAYWDSHWTRLSDFPGIARHNAVAFSIDGYGYFGTGITGISEESQVLNDFWKYDYLNDQWTRVNDFPGKPRAKASSFTIENIAYVGLGSENPYPNNQEFDKNHLDDFYSYDASLDEWIIVNPLPAIGRHSAASFSLNSKGYIIAGYVGVDNPLGNSKYTKESWEFDPVANKWNQIINFPVETGEDAGFDINNKGYVYNYNNLWEYENNVWKLLTTTNQSTKDNLGFGINGLAYFGLGDSYGSNNIYEFDLSNSELSSKPLISGLGHWGSSVFIINNKAYIMGGINIYGGLKSAVWEFDPMKTPGFRN
ncbi:IPT/TIG domain-containing protein [Fulvivirgaceae bacterium LMO-SS25]